MFFIRRCGEELNLKCVNSFIIICSLEGGLIVDWDEFSLCLFSALPTLSYIGANRFEQNRMRLPSFLKIF